MCSLQRASQPAAVGLASFHSGSSAATSNYGWRGCRVWGEKEEEEQMEGGVETTREKIAAGARAAVAENERKDSG